MLSHHIDLPRVRATDPFHCTPASAAIHTFHHGFDVYLKDSNAYGNTYFSRYFEWQGVCRERWFHDCIASDMLRTQGVFITKRASVDYLHETFPFQHVGCELNTYAVRQCSFQLMFRFGVEGRTVATGLQEIVFARPDKRITRLPPDVLRRIRDYELTDASSPGRR